MFEALHGVDKIIGRIYKGIVNLRVQPCVNLFCVSFARRFEHTLLVFRGRQLFIIKTILGNGLKIIGVLIDAAPTYRPIGSDLCWCKPVHTLCITNVKAIGAFRFRKKN